MPTEDTRDTNSQDPLIRLGPSLFLQTISYLPVESIAVCERISKSWRAVIRTHEKSIWREACHRTGVEKKSMKLMEDMERSMNNATVWSGEPGEEEPMDPGEPTGSVDWRMMCKSYFQLQQNWSKARCQQRWITPPGNTVWRIKIDSEQSLLISTSRLGNLSVADLQTSEQLFILRRVRPCAHLEFGMGFVVFDIDQDNEHSGLEVWRTQSAISRSSNKNAIKPLSRIAAAYAARHPDPPVPLRRGQMSFYRSITPPTPCLAYKVHIDREDDSGFERAILAVAGAGGVYIYDLDDVKKMDILRMTAGELVKVNYIELDDDFVFLCTPTQMHVFSRHSLAKVLSFPPMPASYFNAADMTFSLNFIEDFKAPSWTLNPDSSSSSANTSSTERGYTPSQVGEANVEAVLKGEPGWKEAIYRGLASSGVNVRFESGRNLFDYYFTACHYTPSDLFCTTNLGVIFVVKDYKRVFTATDFGNQTQEEFLASHTISIGVGQPIKQLATHGDHVVVVTPQNILLFNASSLPNVPFVTDPSPTPIKPTFRAYALLGNFSDAISMSSCVQMDRSSIYLVYWALAEAEAGRALDPYLLATLYSMRGAPADRLGVCVKVWDFKPW